MDTSHTPVQDLAMPSTIVEFVHEHDEARTDGPHGKDWPSRRQDAPFMASSPPGYSEHRQRDKSKTAIRPGPWLAFLALLTAVACLAANGIVLIISNQKPQSSWYLRPSVVIGILAPVGTYCLEQAHKEGSTIAWWLKLSEGGTLADMHHAWAVGDSLWNAIRMLSFKSSTILAVSTISLTFSVASSPLLQKAARVESGKVVQDVVVNTSVPVNLPEGWTTTQDESGANHAGTVSSDLLNGLNDFSARKDFATKVAGCNGRCSGKLKAWGLNGTCQEVSSSPHDWAKDFFINGISDPITLFNVSFPDIVLANATDPADFFDPESVPQFNFMATSWSPSQVTYNPPVNSSTDPGQYEYCPGILSTRNCTYFIDMVQYPVLLRNESIRLDSDAAYFGPPQAGAEHLEKQAGYPGQLSGFQIAARDLFSSSLQLSNPTVWFQDESEDGKRWLEWDVNSAGTLASKHAKYNTSGFGSCSVTYTDPVDEITAGLSDILLRTAMSAAKFQDERHGFTTLYQQTLTAQETRDVIIFVTDYIFLALAAAVTLLEMVLVAAPFWGWWRLNRAVSLSPVETAVALKDEIRMAPGASLDEKAIVKLFGEQRVRKRLLRRSMHGSEIELMPPPQPAGIT